MRGVVAAAVGVAVMVAGSGTAAAHVSVTGDIAPGGNGTFTFTVPSESDTANTVTVEIQMPRDHPLGSVRTAVTPGWRATTTTRTIDEPVEVFGEEVTEVIDIVTFTAEPGGGIPPGHFATFSLRGGPFPDVESVAFPTIQTYDDGQEAAWIELTPEGGEEPESPAPVLELSGDPAGSDHGDDAGADSEAEVAGSPVSSTGDDDGTDGLTVAALVIAIVAALLGGAALLSGRRRAAT